MADKCCGTCTWWGEPFGDGVRALCQYPMPTPSPLWVLGADNCMSIAWGEGCPCWKPKENPDG